MRSFLVGLFLLAISGSAFGQAVGFVEKIGFGKQYRSSGWTPMLVNLTSQIGEPAEYLIQVRQEDLDRDRVIFQREIVLNPQKQEQFWVYFMAQPAGLPGTTVSELNKALDVRLCTKNGKPLVKLDVQDAIREVDPLDQGMGTSRGTKLVLLVSDGSSSRAAPSVREFSGAIGLNENITTVPVTPYDLPENVIGYDAVDAIVWLDADAGKMTTAGSRRMAAMTDWVREGGRLVVCQTPERFKLEAMADLLPVELKDAGGDWRLEMRDRADLQPIRRLATFHTRDITIDSNALTERQQAGWQKIVDKGPFKVAFARLRPDAVGEEWIDWKDDSTEVSPWLARRALGLGSVSWVAQDLGNSAITGPLSSGWPYVWDRVLGMRNTDMRVPLETDGKSKYADRAREMYYAGNSRDLGKSLLRGMEHEGRAGGLIFLAGVFFVGYWVLAGPVSYFVLAGKKKTELSWMIFATSALVATLLTVGVVRLVLRGDAAVHHVSLVRMLPTGLRTEDGKPMSRAIIDSRIGLYIPRDYSTAGNGAPVALLENDPSAVSYLTPYSIHPAHQAGTTDFPAYLEYDVPVRDNPLSDPVAVKFPFRRTLKKLQAHWVGNRTGGIEVVATGGIDNNKPKLLARESGDISGKLVNHLGVDLVHVYFAFNSPAPTPGAADADLVLYYPSWPDGQAIDIGHEYATAVQLQLPGTPRQSEPRATPGGENKRPIKSLSMLYWSEYWFSGLGTTTLDDAISDSKNGFLNAFPILCLYDRLKPLPNREGASDRVEVLRRGAREWDISELVAAGQLVIIGQAGNAGAASNESPLPFGMEVENGRVIGTGVSCFQYALPLDRSQLPNMWAKPATDDESGPTTKPKD